MIECLADDLRKYSIIPENFREKDPRTLLYHFPSLPIVKYAKLMQTYSHLMALDVAEDLSMRQGYVLLPFSCIHWKRAQKMGAERRLKIGRNSYYLMRLQEMTDGELGKLQDHIEEVNNYGFVN